MSSKQFSALMKEQVAARKDYDALIRSIRVVHEPSGLPMEVLTPDNWVGWME